MPEYALERAKPASDEADDCLLWRGKAHSSTGAPVFTYSKTREVIATRATVVLFGGVELEKGDIVKHKSGCSPLCVNPDHLHVVRGGGRK